MPPSASSLRLRFWITPKSRSPTVATSSHLRSDLHRHIVMSVMISSESTNNYLLVELAHTIHSKQPWTSLYDLRISYNPIPAKKIFFSFFYSLDASTWGGFHGSPSWCCHDCQSLTLTHNNPNPSPWALIPLIWRTWIPFGCKMGLKYKVEKRVNPKT